MMEMSRCQLNRQKILLWCRVALVVIVLFGVTWLSLAPSDQLASREVPYLIEWICYHLGCAVDKCVHAGMYFIVCLSFLIALPRLLFRVKGCIWAFALAFLWGALMEVAQAGATALGWTSRAFDVYDMLANGVGALLAVAVTCFVRRWRF